MGMGWFCGSGGWSSGAGDVAGVSAKYGRSEKAMDDGVDTDDELDEAGSELRVPAGDPSGVKTAERSVVVAVLLVNRPCVFCSCCGFVRREACA
jgi:hypothetical protein